MPAAGTRADALRVAVSAVEVTHLAAVGTVPGVVVTAVAARCGPGVARIRCEPGSLLSFKAPGSTRWGTPIQITRDGNYLLEDGEDKSKWVRVSILRLHLTVVYTESRIFLTDVYAGGVTGADVDAEDAAAGDVATYELTLTNASGVILSRVRAWVGEETSGIEISADGVSYSTPQLETTALVLGDLAPDGELTLYLRRTIAAAAAAAPAVLDVLEMSFNGV